MLYREFIDSLARDNCPDDMEPCLQMFPLSGKTVAKTWNRGDHLIQTGTG